ncbi:N-6 DNA methylase [Verrucomicrobiaceae bacterium 227]
MSKRPAKKTPTKSFEESLWDTANKLRGSVESSDWSGATEPEWSGDNQRQTTRQGCPEGERGGAHQHGVAGFVLANGSMSTNTKGEGAIRQRMIENDLVDCQVFGMGSLKNVTPTKLAA